MVGADGDEATAEAMEALSWLKGLDPLDAELVEMRASGSPWKPICWRLGIGRATAHRRWKSSLPRIAGHLVSSAAGVEVNVNKR